MHLSKQDTPKEDNNDKERLRLQNMIRQAHTSAKVNKTINAVWSKFDTDLNGVLDKKEAKKFIKSVLTNLDIEGRHDASEFSSWFQQMDRDGSGTIDKEEFCKFISRVARVEMYGVKDLSAFKEQIEQGNHHMAKLVLIYKQNKLEYL